MGMVRVVVTERFANMRGISRSKSERRTETDSRFTDSSGMNSTLLHPGLNKVSITSRLSIKTKESTVSSDILDNSKVSLDVSEFNLEERRSVLNPVQ